MAIRIVSPKRALEGMQQHRQAVRACDVEGEEGRAGEHPRQGTADN